MAKRTRNARAIARSNPSTPTLIPRNKKQKEFIESIDKNTLTFGIGSAGSGKTYVAGHMAAEALMNGDCRKIIICRPVIEAGGERLGFLPGGIDEKCEPYLRPLFDVFDIYWHEFPGYFRDLLKRDIIEISPLAYMRGRTFDDCWIICDEAQNLSDDQMEMLLSRIGENSKVVVIGDPQQRDNRTATGFETALRRLDGCPDIGFVRFGIQDIERSKIVQNILSRWKD